MFSESSGAFCNLLHVLIFPFVVYLLICSYCTSSDVVQFGQAKAALFGSQHSPGAAIEILKANCWPTFSNRRGDLNQLWLDANVAIELAKQNVAALSRMDMIRLRRTLGCDGDGTMAGSCIVGPPNIGYPY